MSNSDKLDWATLLMGAMLGTGLCWFAENTPVPKSLGCLIVLAFLFLVTTAWGVVEGVVRAGTERRAVQNAMDFEQRRRERESGRFRRPE